MQTIVWPFMTYGVLQLGVALGACLLSGWTPLENIGHRICGWSFYFGRGHDRTKLSLPAFILTLSAIFLSSEQWSLHTLRTRKNEYSSLNNTAAIQELKASVLRHQRNWWLCISAILVWGVVWRFSAIVRRLRTEIAQTSKSQ